MNYPWANGILVPVPLGLIVDGSSESLRTVANQWHCQHLYFNNVIHWHVRAVPV